VHSSSCIEPVRSVRPEISTLREENQLKAFFEVDQYRAVHWRTPEFLKPIIETAYITGWRVQVGDP
jgi:hypothetical protein